MTDERPTVLSLDPEREEPEPLRRASDLLREGGLVAYPTETFYGLGCDPRDPLAVDRLTKAKGRTADRPLPLLVGRLEHLAGVVSRFEDPFPRIVGRFWPGPLTLVLPAAPGLAAPVTSPVGTVAVRWTSWPVARRLLESFGGALVGTSANRSGAEPCHEAEAVRRSLGNRIDLILDGGPTPGGLPSTLLDLSVRPPRILREGVVPREDLDPYLV
jgi:L-threonylcarbamoyladenylate synthase